LEEDDNVSVKSETNSEETDSESENTEEFPFKITYRYEFATNEKALIIG
jgi:hypothetical protein